MTFGESHGSANGNAWTAVRLGQVDRWFDGLLAVDNVSFHIGRGEIVGVLGHNGAGKTTLIRLITGLLRPNRGWVAALGLDPVEQGAEVRARTGVLTEYPGLDHFLTPLENLVVHASINGMGAREADRRAQQVLDQLDLSSHRDVPSHSLSAGLKQRVALARALVHDPELLLLDEPTSNLDPLVARAVRDLVLDLSRSHGRTVLLSTHNLVEAQDLCDRVAVLHHGRLLAMGTLDDMRAGLSVGAVELAVHVNDAPTTMAALDALEDVKVAPLARPGTFQVRVAEEFVPEIVRTVVDAGARVQAVRPDTPTLEDVYLSLHGSASPADRNEVLP